MTTSSPMYGIKVSSGLAVEPLKTWPRRHVGFSLRHWCWPQTTFSSSAGSKGNAPRDNVLFEAGFFMGLLGRRKTFLVWCEDDSLEPPSDLGGVTSGALPTMESVVTNDRCGVSARLQERAAWGEAGLRGRGASGE